MGLVTHPPPFSGSQFRPSLDTPTPPQFHHHSHPKVEGRALRRGQNHDFKSEELEEPVDTKHESFSASNP